VRASFLDRDAKQALTSEIDDVARAFAVGLDGYGLPR
jgi:hypothetical protein